MTQVLLHARVSVWSGHFYLVKAVFLLLTLLGHHQVVSAWLSKEQTPVSWASTRPICSYYCCQETDVSSHTGKKVCLWLWSCASARYGCVWVCACAGCGRVGFGKYDLAFPTPGFCPWLWVKCTAMSGHTVLLHHTHTRSAREGWECTWAFMCDCEMTLVNCGQIQRAGWEVVTYSLAFDQPLEVVKTHAHKIKCAETLGLVHRQSNAIWCEVAQSMQTHIHMNHSKFWAPHNHRIN